MQSKAPTVAAYLKELPADRRAEMNVVRKLVARAVPAANEPMAYGMPSAL